MATNRGKKKIAWDIRVTLRLVGFEGSPEEITNLLGIQPTETWRRDDPVPDTLLRRRDNCWMVAAPCEPTIPLGEQVDILLEFVLPAATRFATLPPDVIVLLSCAVYDYTRDVVLALSKVAVQRLASLGAEIDIDYYDMSSTARD